MVVNVYEIVDNRRREFFRIQLMEWPVAVVMKVEEKVMR